MTASSVQKRILPVTHCGITRDAIKTATKKYGDRPIVKAPPKLTRAAPCMTELRTAHSARYDEKPKIASVRGIRIRPLMGMSILIQHLRLDKRHSSRPSL